MAQHLNLNARITMTKPTQPWLVKSGKRIVHNGSRSKCMTYLAKKNGDKVVPNPKFKWIKK